MKEDEYIDLDKVSAIPSDGEAPGLSKKEDSEKKSDEENLSKKNSNKSVKKKSSKKVAKKVAKKKSSKKQASTRAKKKRSKNNKSSKKLIYFLLGLVILAVVVIAVIRLFSSEPEVEEQKVMVLVNGEPLMTDEVSTRAKWLRDANGIQITDEQVLELSIDVEVLFQEAKRMNFSVTEEEVVEALSDIASRGGISYEELKEALEDLEINLDLLKKIIKKEMYASLISQDFVDSIVVSEEELLQYYEDNKEYFFHDELAVVRHIQVDFKENVSYNETLEMATMIKQKADENRSNFCVLVAEYSDDWNTQTEEICGEYVIERDTFMDNFSKMSFELEENETALVKSEVGYHVLLKVESIPAGTRSFDNVIDEIRFQLEVIKAEEARIELIEKLRSEAKIENYVTPSETEISDEVEEPDIIIDLVDDVDSNLSEDIVDEVVDLDELLESDDEEITEEEFVDEDIEEEIDLDEEDEVVEVDDFVDEPVLVETNRVLRLAKCLSDKGAKMYSVYWSPHGEQQEEVFGEYFEHIIRIECDPEGVNPQVVECESVLKKQFPTWPTWIIDGEIHEGYQNLYKLSSISGCPY